MQLKKNSDYEKNKKTKAYYVGDSYLKAASEQK